MDRRERTAAPLGRLAGSGLEIGARHDPVDDRPRATVRARGSGDGVVASNAIEHVPDLVDGLDRLAAVRRDGTRLSPLLPDMGPWKKQRRTR